MMNLRQRLSQRISMLDIQELHVQTKKMLHTSDSLYELLFDSNNRISSQAAWIFTHYSTNELQILAHKRSSLIELAIRHPHPSTQRLVLSLILRLAASDLPDINFINFCMLHITAAHKPSGIRCLCMKLAYQQCYQIPELMQELKLILELLDTEPLTPAIKVTRKNILYAIAKNKPITQ